MKLKSLSYKGTHLKDGVIWQLEPIYLNRFNLIIGKNATGKSKFLVELTNFLTIFAENIGHDDAFSRENYRTEWQAEFELEQSSIVKIHLISEENSVVSEKVWLNEKLIINRGKEMGSIYSFINEIDLKFYPPSDELAMKQRRDVREYPLFEEVFSFSKGFQKFIFSEVDAYSMDYKYHLSKTFPKLKPKERHTVIENVKYLGYEIDDITVEKLSSNYVEVNIKEKGVRQSLAIHELSTGMLRSLTLLSYVEFLLSKKQTTIILIDDLGEGLDYERATKLGKLLVEKLENSNIQFIATSNDSFLMDVIPIKYWNILQRDGNTVRALNYHNSKEQFDNFKFTGLSNFDLFSSDYLMRPKS